MTTEKLSILIIEDNQDLDNLLEETLTPKYDVHYEKDGASGVSALKSQSPDLIILDLMLPTLSGESVLSLIRQTSQIPVIILTAVQQKSKVVELLQKGADDYLTKPFDLDELMARIEVQLRKFHSDTNSQHDQPNSNIINFKDVNLNNQTFTVTRGNTNVNLSRKEFEILELLLQHPYQVFSKANLYESVWNEPFFGDENTITVHLSNLRHKLNLPNTKPYIETVWGIGVRFTKKESDE
ncbi:response regulator transcription factor [Pediococcus argentinicus]|uniref:DNA-binding response regulator, OmpR family (Rec-wHTH domains) n=1 Tax=Pediococcus argentinicus TaxID=480391 RepID=A0A0R2NJC7_9LACO|nr:response regulator transcription factor [Pediococcus argentinicus]KRO25877.1 DNA-binding response regulator, OmpR family (Rec-wHTH domains) [Pediococcus argentinicus]NKZ21870.1 response regulator transcription factor [Pediococcus argentinicus]GEP19040.1 DNA-binding response regulator [Pediococcus argentinicus]